ncbi:MAG: UDP-N-acetylmuramoyl-L-alanyl-D-glutamate--2,6-diaminopimelate ligase [Betaproteobacteria bacterium]
MIDRIASDSRRVAPGVAFFAYPGEAADGRGHIPDALARGAAAVVWESADFAWDAAWGVPNVGVSGLKRQAGALAHEFYGRPSESLWTCGVTGTNGKTSCTQWIAAAIGSRGDAAGVIGTLGARFNDKSVDLGNTTPDALELHRLLAEFVADGAKALAMEVSSHGLVQGRVNAVNFDCALFTNLTHDHLDFHGTMEAYAAAKAKLFEFESLRHGVVNLDDVVGVRLARRLAERKVPSIGYSLSREGVAPGSVDAYIAACTIQVGFDATHVEIDSSWGKRKLALRQLGRFNVSNLLGVLGCLIAYGLDFDAALQAIESLPDVDGRMQRLGGEGRPLAVVDYAHTPDALEKVLSALRPVAEAGKGRLIAVFGAGGNRDALKRPRMGEIASRLADRVVITSDNPRNEPPEAIIEAIRAGVSIDHDVEPDRAKAIAMAIRGAGPGDVILIAGKGHETYQEVAGRRTPFSDVVVAGQAIATWGDR